MKTISLFRALLVVVALGTSPVDAGSNAEVNAKARQVKMDKRLGICERKTKVVKKKLANLKEDLGTALDDADAAMPAPAATSTPTSAPTAAPTSAPAAVDCAGSWSTCAADCADKTYTVTTVASGNGAKCGTADAATDTCAPGDGQCPAALTRASDIPAGSPEGTYKIDINNVPTDLFCDLTTAGGGWMSFASVPSSGNWFDGNTVEFKSSGWSSTMSYSWGTYSSSGAIGNYWRDFSQQSVTEVLFKTGNGQYWFVIKLTDVHGGGGTVDMVASSGNFGGNTQATIFWRDNAMEDPWINPTSGHSATYMMWGENGNNDAGTYNNNYHVDFKNANGGILAFVR